MPRARARIAMYDDVTISLIPRDALAVAGYVNGRFTTWLKLKLLFPHAHKISIAVSMGPKARCGDFEPGDMTIAQAPAWFHLQRKHGIKRPMPYCGLSNAQLLVETMTAAGIGRDEYDLFTAHYTGTPHICDSSCGSGFRGKADLTQWTDRSHGRSLDESLCEPQVFGFPDAPIRFTRNEAHTLRLLMNERALPHAGDSTLARRRRANIRKYKRTIRVYRAKLRAAAALTGWGRADRRRRYAALLTVYQGGTVALNS